MHSIETYSFIFEEKPKYLEGKLVNIPSRGSEVKKNGWTQEGRVVTMDNNTIVIAWKGYSENPGSRYSGIKSYYPATTEVFIFDHIDKFGRRRYKSLIEWNTRPQKKK